MASNQVVTYEEVKAYQANNGISTYEVGSGGYTTGGIYVDWTTNGFTGNGWDNKEDSRSPVYGMSETEILDEIKDEGNLNEIFKDWLGEVGYQDRYEWIFDSVIDGCRWEVHT